MPAKDQEAPTALSLGKILTYVIYAVIVFGIIMLGFRIFLLAFSANPNTPFVEFVYNTSSDYLNPFRGIFPPKDVGSTGYLDVAALFAIIVYGLIAWGLAHVISYFDARIEAAKRALN